MSYPADHLDNDPAFKAIVEAATEYIDQAIIRNESGQDGVDAYSRISCVPDLAMQQVIERAKADGRLPADDRQPRRLFRRSR